jgi:hypothetical protein
MSAVAKFEVNPTIRVTAASGRLKIGADGCRSAPFQCTRTL